MFGYLAPYAMDDWKVSPEADVEPGSALGLPPAAYDADNHFFWLDTAKPEWRALLRR